MKFISVATALSAVLAAKGAATGSGEACGPITRGLANYDRPFVLPLYDACLNSLDNSLEAHENPWISKTCVAAAIAATADEMGRGLTCDHYENVTERSTWPSLDYNVYASIVGDCAWATGGCPITQQNFIDLIYGTISETSGGPYPDSANTLITYYLDPIFTWTAFDASQGIPYLNFNDWLHYSGPYSHCYPTACD